MAFPSNPKIVRLDAVYAVFHPTFSFPHTYVDYPLTKPSEVPERIADADIVINTRVPITAQNVADWLAAKPGRKMIAVHAIGTDMVDIPACMAAGITVHNVPAASNESVAEHAISLYFSIRRKIPRMQRCLVESTFWQEKGTTSSVFGPLPRTARGETVGIIGGGELGNRVATICRALGMTVAISDRKSASQPHPDRKPFQQVLQESTVIFLTCPLTAETTNMLTITELSMMRKDALVINVARGGIIKEADLLTALRSGMIEGAATDVFAIEPCSAENNVLVKAAKEDLSKGVYEKDGEGALNLVLSPHLAWYAQSSIERLQDVTVSNVNSWVKGELVNTVQ